MKSNSHTFINVVLAIIGMLFAAICVGFAPFDLSKTTKGILVSIWTVCPPIYFYLEWVFLYKESSDYPFDKFKYSQTLARNVWLAVTTILIAAYFKDFDFS